MRSPTRLGLPVLLHYQCNAHFTIKIKDVPDITCILLEKPYSQGPFGAKNVAEPAMVPAAPAICNAIAHATGRRVRDLPANLERVLLGHALSHSDGGLACKIGLARPR